MIHLDKMNAVLKHLNKNKIICLIILLFLLAKLFTTFNYRTVWWDAAVYIGMGKYIYSLGNAGLWEPSRPIILPLMLGFLWKINLNIIVLGRVLDIIFGSLCILLTYLIGNKIFNKKMAVLSSILLALSPTFFFFNGIMLTEIISAFFSLLGIYYFIGKKYFISGAFLGIAFMARFLQLFVFVAVIFAVLMSNKKNIRNLRKLLAGFIVIILPFLILNQILYNNALFPFLQQIFLSKNSGWHNYHSIGYYFLELFKENPLYLSSMFGIFLLKSKDVNKKLAVIAFLLFFVFFNSIRQKEMRFLVILLPYMYFLVSFSIMHIFDNFKNKTARSAFILLVVLSFVLSLSTTYAYYKNESGKYNQYEQLQYKLEKINADNKIWVSNPIMPVSSDKKIDKLMYYPAFNEAKKEELISDSKNADFIFLDSCDLACKPFDEECENNKNELINYFKNKLNTIYSSKLNQCNQYVFQK